LGAEWQTLRGRFKSLRETVRPRRQKDVSLLDDVEMPQLHQSPRFTAAQQNGVIIEFAATDSSAGEWIQGIVLEDDGHAPRPKHTVQLAGEGRPVLGINVM